MVQTKRRICSIGICLTGLAFLMGCDDPIRKLVLEAKSNQSADRTKRDVTAGDVTTTDADRNVDSASARQAAPSLGEYGAAQPEVSGTALTPSPAVAQTTSPSPDRQPYVLDASNDTPAVSQAGEFGDQTPANRPGVSDSQSNQSIIRLRTAVALAQTLPTGSAMGFSLDYQFVGAVPSPQVKYVWVIKPPRGPAVESVVQLQARGTLRTFVAQWPPAAGTYEMRIDQVTRYGRQPAARAVSATYR